MDQVLGSGAAVHVAVPLANQLIGGCERNQGGHSVPMSDDVQLILATRRLTSPRQNGR